MKDKAASISIWKDAQKNNNILSNRIHIIVSSAHFQIEIGAILFLMFIALLAFARRHSYGVDRVSSLQTEYRTGDPCDEFYFVHTIKYVLRVLRLKHYVIYQFASRVCECIKVYKSNF